MVAEIGNLLLTFMSAWIVGKVEAPAKANIMEPNAEMFWMRWKAAGGHFLIAMKIFQMGNRKSKKTPPEPSAPSLSSDNEGRGLSDFGSPYRYIFF